MNNLADIITNTGISIFSFSAKDERKTDIFIRNVIQKEFFIINSSDYDQVIKIVSDKKNKIIYITEPIQSFLNFRTPNKSMTGAHQLSKFTRKLVKICNDNNTCIILKTFVHRTMSNLSRTALPNDLTYSSSFICHIENDKLQIMKSRYANYNFASSHLNINTYLRKEKLIQIKNSTL